jgi:protein TonB
MRESNRRRFGLAIVFSVVAHATALVLILPIFVVYRIIRVLFDKENEVLRVALLFALLLHVVILMPLVQWMVSEQDTSDSELLTVDLWSSDQEAEKEKKKTPKEELEEYQPEEEVPKGQVVEAPPSKDKRRPEDSRFLAEQDSRVEKETRSRVQKPGEGQAAVKPEEQAERERSETEPGGMRVEQDGVAPLPEDLQPADQGEKSMEKHAPKSLADVNLKPSMEAIASALAGTGLDYLDGVVQGDMTALNTMGWTYASFFNRVKRMVERYWHPDVEYRQHDPYGNVYGFKDRVTVLLVVLRGDGSLHKAYVMSPSGAPFLDDEAKEAVEMAAPFPHVPEGLKDRRDGLVKFTFHFIVEVGARPVFRMRRYE